MNAVEVPRQRGLLYRYIVSDSSMFATWPTAYRYEARIDRGTGSITSAWINERPAGTPNPSRTGG